MKTQSMRGKEIDITALMIKHGNTPAVGNAKMNARGDIIGKGGKVITSREDLLKEYNKNNNKSVKQVSIKNIENQILKPNEAVKLAREMHKKTNEQSTENQRDDKKSKRKLVDGEE